MNHFLIKSYGRTIQGLTGVAGVRNDLDAYSNYFLAIYYW